ncbi:MAG: DUF134 domain-containing protein [Theionarchaea archaeon]|nr:DUF134 domain-containing protein [Theionarchaea archaeon]MBU7000374.1 DUF134 domain-containing protein [Theionarchaea archaeon]MBU7021216.1 DUF134 domain-containing protein [Theionarchaea archaeon]
MPRPRRCRRVQSGPSCAYFKPQGVGLRFLEEITLQVDELEAIRLVDLEGKEQTEAAAIMNISQPTLHRILKEAHKKMAEAVVLAKALRVGGGDYVLTQRKFKCYDCGHEWELPYGTGRPTQCPQCNSVNLHRAPEDRGYARGPGGPGGRGRRGPGQGGDTP